MTRVGRPTVGPRCTIQVRVSEEERAAFERRASELAVTLSEWLRWLARRDSGLWTGQDRPDAPDDPPRP